MKNLRAVTAIYLLGLLVGGLYIGIVAPARTVIQQAMGLDDSAGIWMINIYTLFYAAFIPVIGKLADMYGRKRVFVSCLGVFCLGAVMCGVSGYVGGFGLLLAGRVIQAVGACGVIPVANAEMGYAFPPEKRGAALGMAAGVSGISNVLGSAVGSFVVGLVGLDAWPMLFFISVPIVAALIAGAVVFVPERKVEETGRLDVAGSVALVCIVLMLLLSLREVNFLDPLASLLSVQVMVPLVAAVVLAAVFRAVEARAENPVFHLEYLKSCPIVITMAVSFFIGCVIISTSIIPEYAEAVLGEPTGSGGYYVVAVGALSFFGPPLAGRLIDRHGPKVVLGFGLATMLVGYVLLAAVPAFGLGRLAAIASLAVMGLGMGFAMGTPTNYMILANTDEADGASAIATVALVRQVGTTLAPAMYVSFVMGSGGVEGYAHMMLAAAAFCLAALVTLVAYRHPAR